MKFNSKIYQIALLLYLLAIFILSSIHGEEFPKVEFEFSDKIVHIVIYAILFILFFYSLNNQSKYAKLQKFALEFSFLFTAIYGLSDEIHQYFVPKRSCEFADWLADVFGALLMYVPFKIYYSKMKSTAAALMLLAFFSCSSSGNVNQNEDIKIIVTGEEAWLNLMPVVNPDKNNFGFLISLEIKSSPSSNYTVRDLKIYLNNDTVINKNFTSEAIPLIVEGEGITKLNVSQLNTETYLDNSKSLPEEAQFIIPIFRDNIKIKTVKTSKLKINKVY
ncbi:MAG: VanZ family protein [Bacteroidota bacterium]|nr:VanZ family protein [Bacteroidota bacterium]